MRWPALLRGAIGLTLVVVAAVTWTVYRAVRQANESTQWVAHTQEVLAELDTLTGTLVAAESTVVDTAPAANGRIGLALEQADRSAAAAIDRVAALTADNPRQQQRIAPLRQEIERAFASLRARSVAQPADGASLPSRGFERSDLYGARNTLFAMRADENELLRQRAQDDQAAVRTLQAIAAGVGVTSVGLVCAGVVVLRARSLEA